jgi:hypothetical protein
MERFLAKAPDFHIRQVAAGLFTAERVPEKVEAELDYFAPSPFYQKRRPPSAGGQQSGHQSHQGKAESNPGDPPAPQNG